MNFQRLFGSSSRSCRRSRLLFLGDVQHEFQDRGAVLDQDFLEGVDLAVALLDLALRRELAHAADQDILVVRAVEDADGAAAGGGEVGAPEEIVRQLLLARLAERSDGDAERAGGVEHVADGAVLAGGVDALQHHQQRTLAFGVEPVLQLVDRDRRP